MPRTKSRTAAPPKQAVPPAPTDVLTLAEAAVYLRVSVEEMLRLVNEQGLPGRQVGDDWRFFKAAVQDWLSTPPQELRNGTFWGRHFGALKDDPYMEEMLADIYRRRGRPMTEES